MKILAVSDLEHDLIYTPTAKKRFKGINLVVGCGDLPLYYLEYVVSSLDVPLYYVNGNHVSAVEHTTGGTRTHPWGAVNLHMRTVMDDSGLLLAGIEGSLRYNYGPHQYTQGEMWAMVGMLSLKLMRNRILHGRHLDIFITHAPPWQIHDRDDRPHQGVKAFCWLDRVFQPAFHIHGHTHLYRQDDIWKTRYLNTQIVNAYGYREVELNLVQRKAWRTLQPRTDKVVRHDG
jgi:Icc-related predicted phosphoesterase